MAGLSKLQPIDASCAAICHLWHPHCIHASWQMYIDSGIYSLKMYSLFYFVSSLLSGKRLQYFKSRYLTDVLRSAHMLTTNAVAFCLGTCVVCRLAYGRVYFHTPFIGGLIGSFLAIIQERGSRRPALALYVTQLAMETVFKALVSRRYPVSVRHGDIWLFVASMVSTELISRWQGEKLFSHTFMDWVRGEKYRKSVSPVCAYHVSAKKCAQSCLQGTVKLASLGGAIDLLSWLAKVIATRKLSFPQMEYSKFLGLLTFVYRFLTCLLQRSTRSSQHKVVSLIPAAACGLAMVLLKKSSITIWLAAKCLQIYLSAGVEAGYLPAFAHYDILSYTVSMGFLLHCAVFEPQSVRRSYVNFMRDLTGDRLSQFNRDAINSVGWSGVRADRSIYTPGRALVDPKYSDLFLPTWRARMGWDQLKNVVDPASFRG